MTACVGDQHARLVYSLQKLPDDRTQQDLSTICAYLRECAGVDGLSVKAKEDPLQLQTLCKVARYESYSSDTLLYKVGEVCSCSYILLSGSVLIDQCMYLPRNSFGKPSPGANRRKADCLVLEPSEMLVLPSEPPAEPPGRSGGAAPAGAAAPLGSDAADVITFKLPVLLQLASVAQQASAYSDSSSSSAHSAGSVSADDVDLDIALNDSLLDSDEEDGYSDMPLAARDSMREALEKYPADRTEEDIEVLLDFMHNLPAFANMTMATRRSLCAVMVFAVVEKAGTMVMNDGEELDSWSAILNGRVEIALPDGTTSTLQMGDSFGIRPSKEKEHHKGVMRTVVDDCQFVCIAQEDYYAILHQGEANTHAYEENGMTVLVTETRVLDAGKRKGAIVIRGTPTRLISHLVEDHSPVDATYVEDFLLTYRTFLPSPLEVASRLLAWFIDNKQLRARVTRVVLLWVNNHFNDFESNSEMMEFLQNFEQMLEAESMLGQLRMLHLACSAKARMRSVTLTRATRDEPLRLSVLGGDSLLSNDVFISSVERGSRAHECGLRRGDQLLEVNGCSLLEGGGGAARAIDTLRAATHLCITVRSNLLAFRDAMSKAEGPSVPFALRNAGDSLIKITSTPPPDSPPTRGGFESEMADSVNASQYRPIISGGKKHKERDPPATGSNAVRGMKEKTATMGHSSKDKLLKALKHMKLIPKSSPHTTPSASSTSTRSTATNSSIGLDTVDGCSMSRQRSNSDPDIKGSLQRSNSTPDVANAFGIADFVGAKNSSGSFPEHVLKIYKADQTCKYFLVHKETTARDVVVLALRQFGISDHSSNLQNITCNNYSLCEVSVEAGGLLKQKRLPDTVGNLAERIGVHSRYYLRNNMSQESLVPDDVVQDMARESRFTFLSLSCLEIAMQLSMSDYTAFQKIEPTEYVDELCHVDSKHGFAQLQKFSELLNHEMFWVVTEVCCEANITRRAKTLKHFIKIARYCKDFRNFNSTFGLLCGLGHGTVSRLRSTWERLPSKYTKMFTDLENLMDPTRNMAKYRNLLSSASLPPVIPFFPIVKKDLTFIHLGNDTKVDGLINFEKMRMIAKEVRQTCRLASSQYTVNNMLGGMPVSSGSGSVFHGFADASSQANVSGFVTTRRKKRGSQVIQPKKMFEEAQMARWVKSYLGDIIVEQDEDKLLEMSFKCEPNRRMETSSQGSTLSIGSSSSASSSAMMAAATATGPKFGSSSPDTVRKLMSLSESTKPMNPKKRYAQPAAAASGSGGLPSPLPAFRSIAPISLLASAQPAPTLRPVDLSSESSSVVSLGSISRSRKTSASSSASGASETPREGRKSYPQTVPDKDSDSGHCSFASSASGFDAQSTCSVNSANSPLLHPKQLVSMASTRLDGATVAAVAHHRAPLPSYDVLVRESAAVSASAASLLSNKQCPQQRGRTAASYAAEGHAACPPLRQSGSVSLLRHSIVGLPSYGSHAAYGSEAAHGGHYDGAKVLDDEEGVVSMV